MELPESKGATTIMKVVYSFSKVAIFVPVVDTGAVEVAKEFFSNVVIYMGMPAVIV